MQFSLVALFAAVTGVAMASPMSLHNIRSCALADCAIALGPTAVGCTSAAVTLGANPITDAGCIAGVLNSVVNAPAACAGCGTAAGGIVGEAESAVGGAFDDAKTALAGIF